jgi:hypothetical protein
MAGVLIIKRGNLDTDAHTGSIHVKMKAKNGVILAQVVVCQRWPANAQKVGDGLEQTPSVLRS